MKRMAVAVLGVCLAAGTAGDVYGALVVPAAAVAQGDVKLKKEEFDAYNAVKSATGYDAKVAAAKAFLEKYPASAAKNDVEVMVYNELIAGSRDPMFPTRVPAFAAMFPESKWNDVLQRELLEFHIGATDFAAATKTGLAYVATHPDDARVHMRLLQVGFELVKRNDAAGVAPAKTHGARAIALMEANTKPVEMTDVEWDTFKKDHLALAHQTLGLVIFQSGDADTAMTHLTTATTLNPADPLNYFFLASIREMKSDAMARNFNAMKDKASADAKKILSDVEANEDEIIRLLVKSVAMADGRPEAANLLPTARRALEEHYKRRNKGSLDGLDAQIKAAKAAQ